MGKPAKRDQNSLYKLIDTSESLLQSETEWIYQRDDLLALAHNADHGWLISWVVDTLCKFSERMFLVSGHP